MKLLHGNKAPPGRGMVVEVHLDIMQASTEFLMWLTKLGFEDDPFAEFYPAEYRFHYTGRTRIPRSTLRTELPAIRGVAEQVITAAREANVRMYVETELVRRIHHFDDGNQSVGLTVLDEFTFIQNKDVPNPKADIHVEFRSGTVPFAIRSAFQAKNFYWVKTPLTELFPSEEIATLQTSTFAEARQVFDRLLACPPPACTGVHLEQKLSMIPSFPDLPMPPVYTSG